MTQGAVSRQIASLERYLGAELFRRTRHGVVPTPAGATYGRQVAGRLVGLEQDTLDAMSDPGGRALHLAAVPTFATRWLLPRLPDLARHHPELVIHIDARTRPFLFAETPFDAALYAGTPQQVAQWAGTRPTLLMAEDVLPVASPRLLRRGRRWRLSDIARAPLLQQSTRPDAWRQWFEAMGVELASPMHGPRYELFSMLSMAATQGMGVALIPPLLIEQELGRGDLVVVCDRPLRSERNYYLISPETHPARPAIGSFREWLLLQARTGAASGL